MGDLRRKISQKREEKEEEACDRDLKPRSEENRIFNFGEKARDRGGPHGKAQKEGRKDETEGIDRRAERKDQRPRPDGLANERARKDGAGLCASR